MIYLLTEMFFYIFKFYMDTFLGHYLGPILFFF